jgi:hypothetical protein
MQARCPGHIELTLLIAMVDARTPRLGALSAFWAN